MTDYPFRTSKRSILRLMDTSSTALLVSLAFQFNVNLDINELIRQLKKSEPIVPEDLKIDISEKVKVSDDVSVTVASGLRASGSLSMVKTTNKPSEKELELIQAARGNRPYNSISDVQVSYNEQGTITSISWKES
jgi:hypothetical protein